MTDDQVQRIRKHDLQALSEYIEAFRYRLIGFIEQQLGSTLRRKVEPEDILQEVSAEAVRSLSKMEFGDREPLSWLFQIAERKIIDAHRFHFQSQKRNASKEIALDKQSDNSQQGGLIQMLVASMTSASQVYSRQVKADRVSIAMQQLPSDQQEVLRLRYLEDLPSKEIATRMGKSDAAIRVMLTRALKRLQDLLDVGDESAPEFSS